MNEPSLDLDAFSAAPAGKAFVETMAAKGARQSKHGCVKVMMCTAVASNLRGGTAISRQNYLLQPGATPQSEGWRPQPPKKAPVFCFGVIESVEQSLKSLMEGTRESDDIMVADSALEHRSAVLHPSLRTSSSPVRHRSIHSAASSSLSYDTRAFFSAWEGSMAIASTGRMGDNQCKGEALARWIWSDSAITCDVGGVLFESD